MSEALKHDQEKPRVELLPSVPLLMIAEVLTFGANKYAAHNWRGGFDALMHDTVEAFTNDLPTPLKYAVPIFKDIEVKIEGEMARKFGFTYPLADPVKAADLQMLAIEKVRLKKDFSDWAVLEGVETSHVEHLVDLSPMSPARAERLFLERYEELKAA